MFLILTFLKKWRHFVSSPTISFLLCDVSWWCASLSTSTTILLAHHTQSSRHFGTLLTMRIMEWKRVRKKQWLHQRCGKHCCPFTCLAPTMTKLGIPLSGKHLSSIDLDCLLAYWLLTFNLMFSSPSSLIHTAGTKVVRQDTQPWEMGGSSFKKKWSDSFWDHIKSLFCIILREDCKAALCWAMVLWRGVATHTSPTLRWLRTSNCWGCGYCI